MLNLNKFLCQPSFLIIISALFYAVPFLFPFAFAWGIFIFIIPVFYLALSNQLKAAHGFLWGFIAFGLNMSAFLVVIYKHSDNLLVRYMAPLMILIYISIYTQIWFFIMKKICSLNISFNTKILKIVAITIGYFWFLHSALFSFVLSLYGYCFSLPLLPLAAYKESLYFISLFGIWPLVALILTCQAGFVSFCIKRKLYFLIPFFVTLFIFGYGFFIKPKIELDAKILKQLKSIAFLCPSNSIQSNPLQTATEINFQIEKITSSNPDIRLIIMPESSFPFALNECPRSIALWAENGLKKNIHFLIAGHRKNEEGKLFNSLFHIFQGRIILYYDKIFPMLFTEFLPFNSPLFIKINKFIWPQKQPFCAGEGSLVPLIKCDDLAFLPQICADIFLGQASAVDDLINKKIPILCVSNDQWFFLTIYMQLLMKLYLQLISMVKQRDILYVSHTGMWWLKCSL